MRNAECGMDLGLRSELGIVPWRGVDEPAVAGGVDVDLDEPLADRLAQQVLWKVHDLEGDVGWQLACREVAGCFQAGDGGVGERSQLVERQFGGVAVGRLAVGGTSSRSGLPRQAAGKLLGYTGCWADALVSPKAAAKKAKSAKSTLPEWSKSLAPA